MNIIRAPGRLRKRLSFFSHGSFPAISNAAPPRACCYPHAIRLQLLLILTTRRKYSRTDWAARPSIILFTDIIRRLKQSKIPLLIFPPCINKVKADEALLFHSRWAGCCIAGYFYRGIIRKINNTIACCRFRHYSNESKYSMEGELVDIFAIFSDGLYASIDWVHLVAELSLLH